MIWASVLGQERVKKHLRELLTGGRLAHAYLFCGDEGVGKDAMALHLAAVLQCETGGMDACGNCHSCTAMARLRHPDVRLVFALPAGKNTDSGGGSLDGLTEREVNAVREEIKSKAADPYHRISVPRASVIRVNSIREIRREAVLSTVGNHRRVVIISRADEMNEEASNALLKTLEEPTGNTMFILTTAFPERLLPTIRSRCHVVLFDPLTAGEIAGRLMESGSAAENDARLVAHLSMGSYQRARDLLHEDMAEERSRALEFIRLSLGSSFGNLMARIDELSAAKDRDRVVRFLNLLSLWFRDALVLREGRDILNIDQSEPLRKFVDRFPETDFSAVLQETERAVSLVRRNGYIPLVLTSLSISLKRTIIPQ